MTESTRGSRPTGTVIEFDDAIGLGTIATSAGERHAFHCIEIVDGSRAIEIGTEVSFDLLCKFGRYEASNIES